jgi:hypothetical protein
MLGGFLSALGGFVSKTPGHTGCLALEAVRAARYSFSYFCPLNQRYVYAITDMHMYACPPHRANEKGPKLIIALGRSLVF